MDRKRRHAAAGRRTVRETSFARYGESFPDDFIQQTAQAPAVFGEDGGRTYCVMAVKPTAVGAVTAHPVMQSRSEAGFPAEDYIPVAPPARYSLGAALRLLGGLLLAAAMVTSPLWLTSERLLPFMKRLGASSASIDLPVGSAASGGVAEGVTVEPDESVTTTATTQGTTTTTTATTTQAASPADTEGLLPVEEQLLGDSGTRVGSIYVKNTSGYSPDLGKALAAKADCRIKLNAGYQVLVVHTHTTEGYAARTDGLYDPDRSPRTTDLERSVAAVGERLTERLNAAGIRTLHITEVHDHPQYNGSYDRAKKTIESYLEQYPSVEMVLDVHRDAITRDSGLKIKPTAEIDGRKAAQVMIITGCDAGGKLDFPGWKSNLTMALQLQQAAQKRSKGLMRPLSFAPYRYNMHLTPNSLLLEFGTDVNTLDEALYSAELMGDALVEVLLRYTV